MSMRGGEKKKEGGPSMASVHSANQWESADFGDNAQKEKFLRLMGGMKNKHTGRFVIGETNTGAHHSRSDDETKKMEKTLEHQYQVGLEKKLTGQNRRHIGLGFSEPEKDEKEEKAGGTHIRFDEDDDVSKDSEIVESEDAKKDEGDSRSRERDPERGSSRSKERDTSHHGSRDDDRKHRDRDDCPRRAERDDEGRRDSKQPGDKKHGHSEEEGGATEQKRKKHKHSKREEGDGSD